MATNSDFPSNSSVNIEQNLVFLYPDLQQTVASYISESDAFGRREEALRVQFLNEWEIQPVNVNVGNKNIVQDTVAALEFWCSHSSTICAKCQSKQFCNLTPSFMKMNKPKARQCICKNKRYIVPTYNEIPESLRQLTVNDIMVLRPFNLDCGEFRREQHGYRIKTGMIKLEISSLAVIDKINAVPYLHSRNRCKIAYNYLMNSEQSSYRSFVLKRDHLAHTQSQLSVFNLSETIGIECALWPNLYPYTKWCESVLSGAQTRLSWKISFYTKVFSEIIDYCMHFDLLLFHYDRAMYKVISGAINTGRFLNCSPARALDTKPFSATYWVWQHLYLIDAVLQFGLPDVFITISPYEWTFPFPPWLTNIRNLVGRGPTRLAAFETEHIVHVLEQIVRGYLCGSSNAKWTNYIFGYNQIAGRQNVKTYFYRFEFQKRGTVHLHLLVWLQNLSKIQHKHISAHVPKTNEDFAYLVYKLQKSDKPSNCLNMQNDESYFEFKDNKCIHHIKHPPREFALNLRAYIDTLVPTLKCSMDYQVTDGIGMLLRYVSSYVSKTHDATTIDSLYSYNLTGSHAAIKSLMTNKPAEPEMWFHLSSRKIAWTCSRTKRYSVPTSQNVASDKIANAYYKRSNADENHSLLSWLRIVDHTKKNAKPYKGGSTLLGTKLLSVFNSEYFFQYVLLNLPHRNPLQLKHAKHDTMPDSLKWYAQVVTHFPDLWANEENLRSYLYTFGHKKNYVTTVIAYIQSLSDTLFMFNMSLIKADQLATPSPQSIANITLDMKQVTIKTHILNAVCLRDSHYFDHNAEIESDDSDNEQRHLPPVRTESSCTANIEWQRPILITGKPGSGKSEVILSAVKELFENEKHISIAAPTGFLSSGFRGKTPSDVTCETVHSLFCIPVDNSIPPSLNWDLSRFDVIIIDELSMISEQNFNHILSTLDRLIFRPVVVLAGDCGQQQPFTKVQGRSITVSNPLNNSRFVSSTYHYNLTNQHRVGDPDYLKFLDHIRNWVPKQELLDEIQQDRVLCSDENEIETNLVKKFEEFPHVTVLTYTKKGANFINNSIANFLFQGCQPIAIAKLDNDDGPLNIHLGMRVMVTQNIDKTKGVVNGQLGFVHQVQNQTIFLRLTTNIVVPLYPVTVNREEGDVTLYPFTIAYANTMCKAQGQTLDKAVLWFDTNKTPPGAAYVALSRVKSLSDIWFLMPLKSCQFTPVKQV